MVSTSDFPAESAGVEDLPPAPSYRYAFPSAPVATAAVDIGHVGVGFELVLDGEVEITAVATGDRDTVRECVLKAVRAVAKGLMVGGTGGEAPTITSAGLSFQQNGYRLRAPDTMEFTGACAIDVARRFECGTIGVAGRVEYALGITASADGRSADGTPAEAPAWFRRYEQELASIGVVVLVAVPVVPAGLTAQPPMMT